jgi:hypothetical protein
MVPEPLPLLLIQKDNLARYRRSLPDSRFMAKWESIHLGQEHRPNQNGRRACSHLWSLV